MALRVNTVFLQRIVQSDSTNVQVIWLFTTGPAQTYELQVIDWGNGQGGRVVPEASPSFAFTHSFSYAAPANQAEGSFGIATFAARTSYYGFSELVNVTVMLAPDAAAGVFRAAGVTGFQSLMVGGYGADTLVGGSRSDTVHAGIGADSVDGGSGDDNLLGEQGDDSLRGAGGNDFLAGHAGRDSLDGGSGNDVLYGGSDGDTLTGGTGHDSLHGDDADDRLNGGSGNDALFGGDGADTLIGGAGADVFAGGFGADRLSTSADGMRDIFVYNNLGEGGDRISGFTRGEDVLQINFAGPGPLMVGIRPSADLPIGTFLFDTSTSRFLYDPDGSGAQAAVLVATLTGVRAFAGEDLLFV